MNGEEWSNEWGDAETQWFGAILPRIWAFVPTGTILEIAPGFGRWTTYLRKQCNQMILVDLSENCINACQERFCHDAHLRYHINDGISLAMLDDNSLDFVFRFDSLVHAEAEVIKTYLAQLAVKLSRNGVGFLHHSNLGAFQQAFELIDRIPAELRDLVVDNWFKSDRHWRAPSMTAALFETYCNAAGLDCINQELINWKRNGILIDCFSLFTPRGSVWSRPNQTVENTNFMQEAQLLKCLAQMYSTRSFPVH